LSRSAGFPAEVGSFRAESYGTSHVRIRLGLLLAGVTLAMTLRLAIAGDVGAHSVPAGIVFGGALLSLAVVAGWRVGRVRAAGIVFGLLGGAVLVLLPLVARSHAGLPPVSSPGGELATWATVVTLVAVAEEIVLRGILFSLALMAGGPPFALIMTSTAFHVPLYGWHVFPLDLAVGLWLGSLRLATGGVAAPAIAHTVADLATWWLP
jgi:membrane protease YdiL (CAAX protease family)